MRRRQTDPRPDCQARVEAEGLIFHATVEHGEYWSEDSYYELSEAEADAIEAATVELHARCLDAVAHVVARGRYAELGIAPWIAPLIERSWREQTPSVY